MIFFFIIIIIIIKKKKYIYIYIIFIFIEREVKKTHWQANFFCKCGLGLLSANQIGLVVLQKEKQ